MDTDVSGSQSALNATTNRHVRVLVRTRPTADFAAENIKMQQDRKVPLSPSN
jgi:hypothetical protein